MATTKLHRFTLRARQRQVGGSTFTKSQSFTLQVGHPDVEAFKADRAWDHTMVGAPPPPRPQPVGKAPISGDGQAAYRQLFQGLHDTAARVEQLPLEQRRELQRQVHLNRRNLVPLLALILCPAGDAYQAQLEAELPVDGPAAFPSSAPALEAPAALEPDLDVDADGVPFTGSEDSQGDDEAVAQVLEDTAVDNDADPDQARALALADAAQANGEAPAPAPSSTPAPAAPSSTPLAELQALLVAGGGRSSMDELRALARKAGLAVTADHDKLRNRAALITALGELVADAPPAAAAPTLTSAPSPGELA